MAETITIAGKQFPKTGVYVAAAGTAGVLGWAWWTRARQDFAVSEAQKAIDESLPGPVPEPTDTPGFTVTGGVAASTNAEWNEKAVTWLENHGYDVQSAQNAIGKFLQRQHLTAAEVELVSAAIAAAGYPPVDGPWSILRAPVPGPITPPASLPAPSGLRAMFLRWSGNTPIYRITWNAVSGAKDYHVRHVGGSSGFRATTSFDNAGSAPGKEDKWEVAARDNANQIGPYALVSFIAASKTGTTPGATITPTPPKTVTARVVAGHKVAVAWSGATGGPGSYYEIRSRGDFVGTWKRVNGTSYTSGPWRAGLRLAFEVRTRNSKGTSGGTISNAVRTT